MRTRCMGAFVAAVFLAVARATQTIMVDDGDPGIEYRGGWVHNPIDDPKDFNYGGSVTFTNATGSTATSTDTTASAPSLTGSMPQSQSSTFAPGISSLSPSSAPSHAHSFKMTAGAIAGLAVAGLLVVAFIGLVGWRSRRRKPTKHGDLAPYDPGLTALAFEPSEKHERAGEDGGRGSAASSLLSLPRAAPAPTQAPEEARAFWTSVDRSVPHEIQTTDLSGMIAGANRLTGFEPLGSPSSASPLLARFSRRTLRPKGSPITPSGGQSRSVSLLDERRRSVDGGVRIAGGPPAGNLRRQDDDADDVRSGLSTLPPSYQVYPLT